MGSKNRSANTPHIRISAYGSSRVDNVDVVRKALHEDIEIKCFYEGTSTLLVNTQVVHVKAGDVVVINPYEFHATVDRGNENSPGKYHLFMIPLDFFEESGPEALDLRSVCFAQKKCFRTLIENDAQLHSLLMQAAKEHTDKEIAYDVAVHGLLVQIFAILLRRGLQDDPLNMTPAETLRSYRLIEPALRYIRDNYIRNITVEDLAELCQVSKHYFCRVFKTAMGSTAMEYLMAHRLTVADILLNGTEKSITQIAANCGFESANYFGRCYKKHFGQSPSKRRSK